MSREILYVKLEQSKEVENSRVTLGELATLQCKNSEVLRRISGKVILEDSSHGKERYVVSIVEIIDLINKLVDNVIVQNLGETECVVEFQKTMQPNKMLEWSKVALICIILFFGAGFSIMSFNNDVDVKNMFRILAARFYRNQNLAERLLELSYSIGIGVGILVFYNHFSNKKLSKDPTPIEVEMRKYEKEINLTLIEEYGRVQEQKEKKKS